MFRVVLVEDLEVQAGGARVLIVISNLFLCVSFRLDDLLFCYALGA